MIATHNAATFGKYGETRLKLAMIENLDEIKKGDYLLITGRFPDGDPVQLHKVAEVKTTESDGVEIILNRRRNVYFNLGMYLAGASWAKQVLIVNHIPSEQ